jgi:hypothetical protein
MSADPIPAHGSDGVAADDVNARRAFVVAVGLGAVVLIVVARRQWFWQDDWAYLLWRDHLRSRSVGDWLMTPHNGHWVALPALHYGAARAWFGMSSYWPYVLPGVLLHLSAAWMTRTVAIRAGVTAWTATALTSILLVFGSGVEFIAFAAITSWTLSLNAFLAQLLLIDHDEPAVWRDATAAGVGVLGMASSGFGLFYALGVAVWLGVRGRFRTIAVVVGPQVLAVAAWWLRWGRDQAARRVPGPRSVAPEFAVRGITAAFDALLGISAVTGVAMLATGIALVLGPSGRRERAFQCAVVATLATTYLGVGVQRAGFGIDSAAQGRYVAIGAFLLVPVVGLAVDQLRRIDARAIWIGYVVVAVSVSVNLGRLQVVTAERGNAALDVRETLELVAGSDELADADPATVPAPLAPDVQLGDLPELIEEGAIVPRTPSTARELAIVRRALGLDD